MKQHKYESLVKFVKLDGIKEFKDTNPDLFSNDGLSTSTLEIDTGKNVPVTMDDAKNACQKFISGEISLYQLQQWGEWIHMMDFFDLIPSGEEPDFDESLIEVITDIDMLDLVDEKDSIEIVTNIIAKINNWDKDHM